MTSTAALPDNPDLLKAMLLAERAESERLRQAAVVAAIFIMTWFTFTRMKLIIQTAATAATDRHRITWLVTGKCRMSVLHRD